MATARLAVLLAAAAAAAATLACGARGGWLPANVPDDDELQRVARRVVHDEGGVPAGWRAAHVPHARYRAEVLESALGRAVASHKRDIAAQRKRGGGGGMSDETEDLYRAAGRGGSRARVWNEALLFAIRQSLTRPTVHARNLYHLSAVMWDAWALWDYTGQSDRLFYLSEHDRREAQAAHAAQLNATAAGDGDGGGDDAAAAAASVATAVERARNTTLSYAAFRLLSHRFANESNHERSLAHFEHEFVTLQGYTIALGDDVPALDAARLGYRIADYAIAAGLDDGAQEANDYYPGAGDPHHYTIVNDDDFNPWFPGVRTLKDPNRWQRLFIGNYFDQSGQWVKGYPRYTGPAWGWVTPFSLRKGLRSAGEGDMDAPGVYMDPGGPPRYDAAAADGTAAAAEHRRYLENHTVVALWSGRLDPLDGVSWDISPRALGNNEQFVWDAARGNRARGHRVNPHTGAAYREQRVPRGDYTRVLAEFWADGPDSESPPGHWNTILNNAVLANANVTRRFRGGGAVLDELEYDVRAYLALNGGLHDAAIVAWGIKRHYDSVRPISAVRFMAGNGQSTDASATRSYHRGGIPLHRRGRLAGFQDSGDAESGGGVELVTRESMDARLGGDKWEFNTAPECVDPQNKSRTAWDVCGDKVSIYIWDPKWGPRWGLGTYWWPYQRPSFVTPPFPGYVSGHSTFSRTAAELMTLITGDAYFPGGAGVHHAKEDRFLVFEPGPSADVTLTWATYLDASDECSLSRIYGGIHPPADDLPGRRIGAALGPRAFAHALRYFGERDRRATYHTLLVAFRDGATHARARDWLGERVDELAASFAAPRPTRADVTLLASLPRDPRHSARLRVHSYDADAYDKLSAHIQARGDVRSLRRVNVDVGDDDGSWVDFATEPDALGIAVAGAGALALACCCYALVRRKRTAAHGTAAYSELATPGNA